MANDSAQEEYCGFAPNFFPNMLCAGTPGMAASTLGIAIKEAPIRANTPELLALQSEDFDESNQPQKTANALAILGAVCVQKGA